MSQLPRVSRDDPSSPDDAIDAVAADWVTRVDAGLTREEQQIFQDWLGADPRHADAFDRYTEAWSVFDRVQERGAASVILDRLSGRARQRKARRVRTGIAAGLIVAAGLFWLQWRTATPRANSHSPVPAPVAATPDPIRRLPDGSIVELNGDAEIAVQYSETERRVKLVKGEAFFQVEKNKARPFYVEANGVVVRAVGTAFAVQMNPSAVEVVVKEGAVDVNRTSTPAANPVRVEAGSRVVMPMMLLRPANRPAPSSAAGSKPAPIAEEAAQPESMSAEQMDARLAWRLPWVNFDGTTLAEAVAQMNRHNRLQLRVEDPVFGNTRVSGIYRADNLEGFLRMLEITEIARGERRGPDEVVLRPVR